MTAHPEAEAPPSERRVRVWFGRHLMSDYRADPVAAVRYARAMDRHFTGLEITVDDTVTEDLRRLPGELLWTIAP